MQVEYFPACIGILNTLFVLVMGSEARVSEY